MSVYYEKTGFVTDWSDDEIEKCGKRSMHYFGKESLISGILDTE